MTTPTALGSSKDLAVEGYVWGILWPQETTPDPEGVGVAIRTDHQSVTVEPGEAFSASGGPLFERPQSWPDECPAADEYWEAWKVQAK